MVNFYNSYQNKLEKLAAESLSRKLLSVEKKGKYIFCEGKKYLNLSSNDYLGYGSDEDVREGFDGSGYSFGSTSSRLLTGNDSVYSELEGLISKIYAKEAALLFNSGYHANVGIMSGLASKKDVIFSDKLNHASIIDGIRLSGADFYRYKHLDYENLENLLQKHRDGYENAIIVSESLFSMDGDIADLKRLVELKKKYNSILIVDEAHAFGVYGERGLGVCEAQGCLGDVDLIVATFGKAVASVGAFCTGDGVLIDYLINKARPLIFSTALPQINIAFSLYMINEVLPESTMRRKKLFELTDVLRSKIRQMQLQTMGESYIVPVIIGANNDACKVSEKLMEQGYYLLPLRHPTVPVNTARLRVSLRADLEFSDLNFVEMI